MIEPFERAEQPARVAVRRDQHRSAWSSSSDSTRECSTNATPALAARSARRRTTRAGWIAASSRMEDRRREAAAEQVGVATRRRSRPRAAPPARRGSPPPPRRRPRAAGCPCGATRRRASAASRSRYSSVSRQYSAARSGAEPLARLVVRHRAAAQREAAVASARALPDARARRARARAVPPRRASAHAEMPVMPAPTISTSARHRSRGERAARDRPGATRKTSRRC